MNKVISFKDKQQQKAAKRPLSLDEQREKIVCEDLAPLIEAYHLLRIEGETSELYQHFVQHQEKAFLQRLLNIAQQDVGEMARLLEMDRFTVQQKLKEHGLI